MSETRSEGTTLVSESHPQTAPEEVGQAPFQVGESDTEGEEVESWKLHPTEVPVSEVQTPPELALRTPF